MHVCARVWQGNPAQRERAGDARSGASAANSLGRSGQGPRPTAGLAHGLRLGRVRFLPPFFNPLVFLKPCLNLADKGSFPSRSIPTRSQMRLLWLFFLMVLAQGTQNRLFFCHVRHPW